MGAGKSSVGRRVAECLDLPFIDGDAEVERAAGCAIAEYFARFGEAAFRAGEARVMHRLLNGSPAVIAAGGGAYVDPETRMLARDRAVTVFLDVPLADLVERTAGRTHRPLLNVENPEKVLAERLAARRAAYEDVDLVVSSAGETAHDTADRVIEGLRQWAARGRPAHAPPLRLGCAAISGETGA